MIVILFPVSFILNRNKKFFYDTSLIIMLFFLSTLVFSFFNVPHELLGTAGNGLRKALISTIFALAIAHCVNSEKKMIYVIASICVAYLIYDFSIFYQYLFHPKIHQLGIIRASGFSDHPNVSSVNLCAHAFLFLCLGFFYFEKYKGLFLKILALGSIIAITITFSRGGAIAIVITSSLLFCLKRSWKLCAAGVVTIIICISLLPQGVTKWIKYAESPSHLYLGGYNQFGGDESQRLNQWKAALNAIRQHPLLGIGINTFPSEYPQYKVVPDPLIKTWVHNAFLEHLAETGIFGFIALCILIIFLYKRVIKVYTTSSSKFYNILSLGLGLSLTAYLIHSITEPTLQLWRTATTFWFLAGLIIALHKLNFNNQS